MLDVLGAVLLFNVWQAERRPGYRPIETMGDMILGGGSLCCAMIFSVPGLALLWRLPPEYRRRADRLTVFLVLNLIALVGLVARWSRASRDASK